MMEFFQWMFVSSLHATVLIPLILVFQWAFRKRLSARARYSLWWIVLIRLCIPVFPESPTSIFNWLEIESGNIEARESEGERSQIASTATRSQQTEAPRNSTEHEFGLEDKAAAGEEVEESIRPELRTPEAVGMPTPVVRNPVEPRSKMSDPWDHLFWAWLIGMAGISTGILVLTFRIRRRTSAGVELSDPDVLRVLQQCCCVIGIAKVPQVLLVPGFSSPAVIGVKNPKLILPQQMITQFSPAEFRLVFLHELAHIKHRDILANWIQAVLQTVHWFNPVIWFAFHRMRMDRELRADELTLSVSGKAKSLAYGDTILKVLSLRSRPIFVPGAVGILEKRSQLKARMMAIAAFGQRRPWKWLAIASISIFAIFCLTDAVKLSAEPGGPGGPSDNHTASPSKPANSRSLGFRLLEYDTSKPVPDVKVVVKVEKYETDPLIETLLTDANGECAFRFDPQGSSRLSYHFEKEGYLYQTGEWIKHEVDLLPETLELVMSQGVAIGGVVTNALGDPIEGVEVLRDRPTGLVIGGDYAERALVWKSKAEEKLAVTDGSGRWTARCQWPSSRSVSLRLRHPDYADTVYSTEVTKAMEAEGRGHFVEFGELAENRSRLQINEGVAISGKIVSEAGKSLQGVTVACIDDLEILNWNPHTIRTLATTDAQGVFQFSHLPRKVVKLVVQAQGFVPAVRDLDLNGADESVFHHVMLETGETWEGAIRDNEGNPVSGARITFEDWGPWKGVRWESESDNDGRFVWRDAPSNRFRVKVSKAGFMKRSRILQVGQPAEFYLTRTLKISGKVIDAESKQPVERFRLYWSGEDDMSNFRRNDSAAFSGGSYAIDVGKLHARSRVDGYFYDLFLRVEADGYVPLLSREFSPRHGEEGTVEYDIELERARRMEGRIVDQFGRSVSGAQIAVHSDGSRPRLEGGSGFVNLDRIAYTTSDSEGAFQIFVDSNTYGVVIAAEEGFGYVLPENLTSGAVIELKPWATITGTLWQYDRRLPGEDVQMGVHADPGIFHSHFKVTTDEQGQFSFRHVPPLKCTLYRLIPWHRGATPAVRSVYFPEAGETLTVNLGDRGRPVVGKLEVVNDYVEIDFRLGERRIHAVRPKPPRTVKTAEEFQAWRELPAVKRAFDQNRSHPVLFSPDGSFRIDEVIPGKYAFDLSFLDPRKENPGGMGEYIARYTAEFEIPESPEQDSTVPFDLGKHIMALQSSVGQGQTLAPAFTALGFDNKRFNLADYRGKYVVLDFWTTWCGPCIEDLPTLRKVYKAFGNRSDFALISLSVDRSIVEPRKFVEENDMPWIHGYLGEMNSVPTPREYGVRGIPAIFIINPKGEIIERNLPSGSLMNALETRLK